MIDNSRQLRGKEEKGEESEGQIGPRGSVWARMKDKFAKATAIVALSGLAVAASRCTYDVPPVGVNDSGMDASVSDSGPDADAGPDHDGGEGGMDAGHDAGDGGDGGGLVDGGYDGGEGGVDGGSIVCASTTTGNFGGLINTATAQNVAGYTFHYGGTDGSGNPIFSISCTEGTFDTNQSFTLSVETDVSRPSDGLAPAGRTIKVTPSSANATTTTVSINVTHP